MRLNTSNLMVSIQSPIILILSLFGFAFSDIITDQVLTRRKDKLVSWCRSAIVRRNSKFYQSLFRNSYCAGIKKGYLNITYVYIYYQNLEELASFILHSISRDMASPKVRLDNFFRRILILKPILQVGLWQEQKRHLSIGKKEVIRLRISLIRGAR